MSLSSILTATSYLLCDYNSFFIHSLVDGQLDHPQVFATVTFAIVTFLLGRKELDHKVNKNSTLQNNVAQHL